MKYKFFLFIVSFVIFAPLFTFAQNNTPFITLVGIPGLDNITGDEGLNSYINALYRISISIAALLAVIKIVAAGAKYMLSDIVTNKEEAKKDIQGALIGLLIVISAIIILNTINTDLTKINFNLEQTDLKDEVKTGPLAELERICGTDQSTCTIQVCTDSVNKLPGISEFLPNGSGSSCQADCTAAKGFAYKEGTNPNIKCAVNNQQLAELMIDSACNGSAQCSVLKCNVYGADYNTCPGACSGVNGIYTSNGQTCLVRNGTTPATIACTGATSGGGGRSGFGGINSGGFCQSARADCYDRSGYVTAASETSVTCAIPRDLAAEAEAALIAEQNRQMSECLSQTGMRWDALSSSCVLEVGNATPII